MILGYIVLTILMILIVLLLIFIFIFSQERKFRILFDMDDKEISADVMCLYPFLRIQIKTEDYVPFLIVYIYSLKIYKSRLKLKKHANKTSINLLKTTNPNNINVTASYGFTDPFTTGIICGTLNIAARLIKIDILNQYPDFLSVRNYLHVDATADINVVNSIVNFVKNINRMR